VAGSFCRPGQTSNNSASELQPCHASSMRWPQGRRALKIVPCIDLMPMHGWVSEANGDHVVPKEAFRGDPPSSARP